jgi:hypothetical protein
MTTKLSIAVGVPFLVLGVAGMAVIAQAQVQEAQEGQEAVDRSPVEQQHFVVESLGTSAAATDVWSVQCGSGTGRVIADVNDNGGVDGILFNVAIVNPQGRAASRTASDNGISADAILSGGPGNYLVLITKTAGGFFFTEAYDSIIHCQTAAGANTLHNVVLVQDQ